MKVTFRQGIVRHQTDVANNPTFLQKTPTGVSLIVSPDPTILIFAHDNSDYLFEEGQTIIDAWLGPFSPVGSYWLYWDIDPITGERTFGQTTLDPVYSATPPPTPVNDQHWFDIINKTMKVNQSGRWTEKIRVFGGQVENGVLVSYTTGTQSGLNSIVDAGYIIFDEDLNAVKKFDRFGRGNFITTTTPLSSQISKQSNIKVEAALIEAKASEYIPQYHCIMLTAAGEIGLADQMDVDRPAIGISNEEMYPTEVRTYTVQGYINNLNWKWQVPPGSPLFVGSTGNLSTSVPQTGMLQQVAIVVSNNTILVDIHHPILFLE